MFKSVLLSIECAVVKNVESDVLGVSSLSFGRS